MKNGHRLKQKNCNRKLFKIHFGEFITGIRILMLGPPFGHRRADYNYFKIPPRLLDNSISLGHEPGKLAFLFNAIM